jgi:hypothetical protein
MFSFGNNNGFQPPQFPGMPQFINPAQQQNVSPSPAVPAIKSALIDAPTTELSTLFSGQFMKAAGRDIYLVMQNDGNLVLYRSIDFSPHQAAWSTNTYNKGVGPYRCVIQTDGNFVIYDSRNAPLWASNTDGKGPHCVVLLQNSGDLTLLSPSGHCLWSSNSRF